VVKTHSNLGAFFCPHTRAKKPGFPLQFLGFAYANPVGFSLQSLAQRQLENTAPELPLAIPETANCQRQLAARNQAAAIFQEKNCVVCHQAQRYALCLYVSLPAATPGFFQILNRLLRIADIR
jgi:hypothetical protein